MSQFTDMLRERLVEAQKRMVASQQKLQVAQAEHQAVMQEFTSLQTLISVETQREQQQQHREMQQRGQVVHAGVVHPGAVVVAPVRGIHAPPATQPEREEINKTELIRDVLNKHADGITPAQVYAYVKGKIDRPYIYSVLKRMKDKREVAERSGKYYLQVTKKAEDIAIN